MVIYWPIEVKVREFEARLLSTLIALEENYKVVLGGKDALYNNSHRSENGIFILKSPHFNDINRYHKLKKDGHKIVSNNEEGLMYFSDDNYLRTTNNDTFKLLDLFFCWGEEEKRAILSKFFKFKDKVIVSGNPRIDILKERYKDLKKDELEIIKKKFGKYILLTTKFARYNIIRRGWRTYLQGQKKAGYVNNLDDKRFAILSENHEKRNLTAYINFIESFSRTHPDKKLLVKPHPVENEMRWKTVCANKKNVILVDNKYDTNDLIRCSDLLISFNCTTSVEAYLMKKKSINYIPYQCEAVEYKLPKLVSRNIYNLKDLNSIIKLLNHDDPIKIDKNQLHKIKERIYNIDEINSTELILKSLKKISPNKIKSFIKMNIFEFYKLKLKKKLSHLFNLYFTTNSQKKGIAKLYSKKFKDMPLSEVKSKFKKICLLYNKNFNNYKILELYPGFILFKKK